MCGITGLISTSGIDTKQFVNELHQMNQLIKHRGPDNEGISIFKTDGTLIPNNSDQKASFGFGHRRLSIIDLTPEANQPMFDEKGDFCISYNGEIFNYIEIRNELKAKGHIFQTQSDTEVLIHGYDEWGTELYEKLEGMWAFALFSKKANKIILSRDRTGVKPLFYVSSPTAFRFASEIKALLPFTDNSINTDSYSKFILENKFDFGANTFFRSVNELKPGTELIIDLATFNTSVHRYFDPLTLLNQDSVIVKSDNELSEELYSILSYAIKIHSRSDVAVGSCLSGGLDSSTIVSFLRKLNPNISIPVFSAIFPGEKMDESELISASVDKHNLEWNSIYPTSNALNETLEDVAFTQEFPLISTSTFAQYEVMKAVNKKGIKVLVNGQGADELLGGYIKYGQFQQLKSLQSFNINSGLIGPSSLNNLIKEFGKNVLADAPRLKKTLLFRFKNDTKFLSPDILSQFEFSVKANPRNLNEFLIQDYYQGFLSGLLRAEDRNSMRFSIESRVPFASSHALAKWTFSLPSHFKYKHSTNKPLLRNLLRKKDLIPPSVLNKKNKLGFSTPMNNWISASKHELLDYIDYIPSELLANKNLKEQLSKSISLNAESLEEKPESYKWITLGSWFKVFKK
ncbi:MAG: asparagine synthase (glutamine-hydrolyzing) [Bacteroidetes bacterium]|nr:asparagine synthase (glutamine-hydrolyzing) [Bacteroidota bacterium]